MRLSINTFCTMVALRSARFVCCFFRVVFRVGGGGIRGWYYSYAAASTRAQRFGVEIMHGAWSLDILLLLALFLLA
ncbi:hypothetical protein BDV97DRAFT_347635 [Delphinella strobiligena]|nr:hypothetical protein BDV97DRAFT_347635 [Delphinella strobiligena]